MNTVTDQSRQEQTSASARKYLIPPADIFGNSSEYLLEIDMPGIRKEDLNISIEADRLMITAVRHKQTSGEPIYQEQTGNGFFRAFELGNDIDREKIRAEMNQGVLRLYIPKADRVKPRKITIE